MRRPRLFTWTKWISTLAALVFLAAAVSSIWLNVTWISSNQKNAVSLGWGMVFVDRYQKPIPIQSGLGIAKTPEAKYNFGYSYMETPTGSFRTWHLPLWPLVLISAGLAGWFWYSARHFRVHQCSKCGYDRRGLAADAKCPECGAT